MSKTSTQQQQQQQQGSTEIKKKSHGGRHRIFTAEQRKDRNRLAQAAFRERRNQYTRTLENTVVELEAIIRELQVHMKFDLKDFIILFDPNNNFWI